MTTTDNQIHGHEVLAMMTRSGRHYNRSSLIDAIQQQFGETARFYICSGGGMNAAELVDTLISKGKFMGSEDAFVFNPATKCDH